MVFISTDFRIYCYNEKFYLENQHYFIVKRYYENFGKIYLNCRKIDMKPEKSCIDCTAMLEEVIGVKGFSSLFVKSGDYKYKLQKGIQNSDLVVLRFGSILSIYAEKIARKNKKIILSELMSDVWNAYWNHGIIGKILAPYLTIKTKMIVRRSNFATYVTEKFLQNRYPCKNESLAASDVKIVTPNEETLQKRLSKIEKMDTKHVALMTSAAVNVVYKGQEYVIKAIPELLKKGITVDYYLAGGGSQERLLNIAKKYQVEQNVHFLGRLPLEQVFEYLQKIDIYIQPSLQEGLPRAMIEAMSFACPCLGARTAGIPELIEDKYVFKRKSSQDIVNKIIEINQMDNFISSATYNFEKSKEFKEEELDSKRNKYYQKIKDSIEMEKWH